MLLDKALTSLTNHGTSSGWHAGAHENDANDDATDDGTSVRAGGSAVDK